MSRLFIFTWLLLSVPSVALTATADLEVHAEIIAPSDPSTPRDVWFANMRQCLWENCLLTERQRRPNHPEELHTRNCKWYELRGGGLPIDTHCTYQ